jgi:hypothetical protein
VAVAKYARFADEKATFGFTGNFTLTQESFLYLRKGINELGKNINSQPLGDYCLFGLFDSGTDWFDALISRNFPTKSHINSLWKHSQPSALKKLLPGACKSVPIIFMVRDYVSQFISWNKAWYNLRPCFGWNAPKHRHNAPAFTYEPPETKN